MDILSQQPVCPGHDRAELSRRLLDWYGLHGRDLPWRVPPGGRARPDPYRVWLSEIMLQQTTVATVKGYFDAFLTRWPTVTALADAPLEDVLEVWAGLGYYARARNLHKAARIVARAHGGHFPDTEDGLRALPGVGRYTAAAIAAIAFGRRATVVDGNVVRVMARLFAVSEPLPAAKPRLYALADTLTPDTRPGDHAQAVMDLGATICTPRNPDCHACPWTDACAGRMQGIVESLPVKSPKAAKPIRRGVAFWLQRTDGHVLLRRRPPHGLLGGMLEVPSTGWIENGEIDIAAALADAPVKAQWRRAPGIATHTFTHFHLELAVLVARVRVNTRAEGYWISIHDLDRVALPTCMKKVARVALEA